MLGNLGVEGFDEMDGAVLKGTKRRCLQEIFWFMINVLKPDIIEEKFRRYLISSTLYGVRTYKL